MLVHLGMPLKKGQGPGERLTRCKKSVKRRWWVPRYQYAATKLGLLGAVVISHGKIDRKADVTCPGCLKGLR